MAAPSFIFVNDLELGQETTCSAGGWMVYRWSRVSEVECVKNTCVGLAMAIPPRVRRPDMIQRILLDGNNRGQEELKRSDKMR
jgi:hypothetical protein